MHCHCCNEAKRLRLPRCCWSAISSGARRRKACNNKSTRRQRQLLRTGGRRADRRAGPSVEELAGAKRERVYPKTAERGQLQVLHLSRRSIHAYKTELGDTGQIQYQQTHTYKTE